MVIVRLTGGLGNQMFHYAIARNYLAGKKDKVFVDVHLLEPEQTDIEKINQRPFALGIFKNLRIIVNDNFVSNILRGGGYLNKFRRLMYFRPHTVITQKMMEVVPVPSSELKGKNIRFEGNFQSEKFFSGIREELFHEFAFPQLDATNEQLRREIENTPDAVSIHVRRGDYLSSSNRNIFTSVNLEYYSRAIEQLSNDLNKKLDAFVFTDDIVWTREHLSRFETINAKYIEGNTGANSWKDMCLMTSCQHHIIANSSFSWWGAWLSKREGINIAPMHWYLPNTYEYSIRDIVPEAWQIINYQPELSAI